MKPKHLSLWWVVWLYIDGYSGDLISRGSLIQAGNNITLDAADDIHLLSAENHESDNSTNESSSAGIGLTFGGGSLVSVNVSASASRGVVNQSYDQYLETTLTAGHQVEITSGGDTHLEGGQVFGKQITAEVGGDLSIISQQDQEHYSKEQDSWGLNVGIGIGAAPISVSANYSELDANSNYVAVQEQSGLFAGDGGFDVNVGGNTHLEGAAIVSSADSDQNAFSTNTLTYDTIENHAAYDIESNSVSFSTSFVDNSNKDDSGSPVGLSGGSFSDSGSASNTTYSMISEGNTVIHATPNMSLDDLREADDRAHQVLEHIFDESMVQDAEEVTELVSLFAEEAFTLVGNLYAEVDKAEAALEAARKLAATDPNYDLSTYEAALAEAQSGVPFDKTWAHAIAGGLTAAIGGGTFLDGAMAAGVNEAAASSLQEALGKDLLLTNLAKAIIGNVISGPQGALIASSADMFNNQVHSAAEREIQRLVRQEYFKDVDANEVLTLMHMLAANNTSALSGVDASELEAFSPVTLAFYRRYSGLSDLIVTDYDQNQGIALGVANALNPVPFTSIDYENDRQQEIGENTEDIIFYASLPLLVRQIPKVVEEIAEELPGVAQSLSRALDDLPTTAHKPDVAKPTTGGKTDVDLGKGADYDGSEGGTSSQSIVKEETGGTLIRHDNFGGHAVQMHVGKTDQELLDRFSREPHISGSSTFTDISTADRAVGQTVNANKTKIDEWLSGSDRRLELNHETNFDVGRVIPNGATTSQGSKKVFVLIERDPLMPNGYRIHTAYPE